MSGVQLGLRSLPLPVGTDKRERQKANRQLRLEELAQAGSAAEAAEAAY